MRIYTIEEIGIIIKGCTTDKELNQVAAYIFENARHYTLLKGIGIMKTFGVMLKLVQQSIANSNS
ncbi:hypothetical protein MH928_17415 [Flavobacterium sp. WW92]|uniref:hypothetical protein n=1 Tax=unclassified Flavobacterium TaxID=196869 RepID=UPI002225AF22|nr:MULTISPECIES: hypothetical protein [unclassified Flavobacterium]WDO13088.1 hypothetical protein MH928_17415 [Flavobacterium sp. WW92]